jgi:hypothetical protein
MDTIAIGRSPFYFSLIPSVGSKADVAREWQLKSVADIGVQTGDHSRGHFEKINQIDDLDGYAIEHYIEHHL